MMARLNRPRVIPWRDSAPAPAGPGRTSRKIGVTRMKAIIGAIHRSGVTRLGVHVGMTAYRESILSSGTSVDEAVLRGWTRGIEVAREMGAAEVGIVVNRPVLEGHLCLGWQVRSLGLLKAWREFACSTEDLPLTFVYGRKRVASVSPRSAVADGPLDCSSERGCGT